MTTTTPRTRLSPEERRTRLLELGVRLFSSHTIEDISIDLVMAEAGVSRGLIYHYFDGKQGYREAVVRYAADDLFDKTAPPEGGEPLERLAASITAYVDYVVANEAGYRSLVAAAAGGNEVMRAIYDETFEAMGERFFAEGPTIDLADTPAVRMIIRGWQAMAEKLVLGWCADPEAMSREELLTVITASLPTLIDLV
ncbi:TetR/AcrR family transcriptional regulator [Nocardioides maradonensis]